MKIKCDVNKSAVAKKGKTKPRRSRASGVLSSIHETMSGLHAAGVVKTETMREFDKLCLEPVEKMGAKQIAALRQREKVSQRYPLSRK